MSAGQIRTIAGVIALPNVALIALLSLGVAGCESTSERFAPATFTTRDSHLSAPGKVEKEPAVGAAKPREDGTPTPPEVPFTTVIVPGDPAIAPPEPLIAPPLPNPVAISAPSASILHPLSSGPFPPPPSSSWPTNWINVWIPLESWGRYNGLGKPIQVAARFAPTYEFHTTNGIISLRLGSRIATCNGLDYWLGYAPQILRGLPCIYWLDAQKNLQPWVTPLGWHLNNERTIVIDPGHGGKDSGTRSIGKTLSEKAYTLDWALRLRRLLSTNGWKVLLTRTNDWESSLSERVAVADRANADLFLSLHFNSGLPNKALAGVETYCLTPVGLPSSLIRDYEDDSRHTFPNNAFDDQNFQLACRLHRSVIQALCAVDRGVRRARFMGVLRGQNRPAVLIEAGYLSNTTEARKISSADYRQQLAEAVAKALQ